MQQSPYRIKANSSAGLNIDKTVPAKMEYGPCGHYTRPDVLELTVKKQPAAQSYI